MRIKFLFACAIAIEIGLFHVCPAPSWADSQIEYHAGEDYKDYASGFKSAAVKVLSKSETIRPQRWGREFNGVRQIRDIFGTERKKYPTQYMYVTDKNIIHTEGSVTWYPHSKDTAYLLYYQTNAVTKSMKEGDILFVGKNDSDIAVLLIDHKSAEKEKFLKSLGAENKAVEEKSWLSRLWGTPDQPAEPEPEAETSPLPVDAIPAASWIRIYFTPGPDCENNIIEQLNGAKKQIDIAVYSITNRRIAAAIIAAKDRGLKVTVITDRLQSAGKGSLAGELESAGIPLRRNTGVHKIMHNKFAVFDGKDIVTGSYNWTAAASAHNAENCLFFRQPDTKSFSKKFAELWQLYGK